jgi:hypothetical protein
MIEEDEDNNEYDIDYEEEDEIYTKDDIPSSIQKKLDLFFSKLNEKGYCAKQDLGDCQTCGLAELPKDVTKYVFYHNQDTENLCERKSCYLTWGGNGNEIVEIAKETNIKVEWDGKNETRILIDFN